MQFFMELQVINKLKLQYFEIFLMFMPHFFYNLSIFV